MPKSKDRSADAPGREKPTEKPAQQCNAKERAFCREYLKERNITKAMIAVGYSEKNADANGYLMLGKPWVLAEIQRLEKLLEDEAICTIKEVDGVLSQIIRYDHSDYEEMLPDGEVVRVYNKTKPNRKAVKGLLSKLMLGGEGAEDVRIAGIEPWDKPRCIDIFYKRHGVYAAAEAPSGSGMTVNFNIIANSQMEKPAIDVPSEIVESPRLKKTFALAIAKKANA